MVHHLVDGPRVVEPDRLQHGTGRVRRIPRRATPRRLQKPCGGAQEAQRLFDVLRRPGAVLVHQGQIVPRSHMSGLGRPAVGVDGLLRLSVRLQRPAQLEQEKGVPGGHLPRRADTPPPRADRRSPAWPCPPRVPPGRPAVPPACRTRSRGQRQCPGAMRFQPLRSAGRAFSPRPRPASRRYPVRRLGRDCRAPAQSLRRPPPCRDWPLLHLSGKRVHFFGTWWRGCSSRRRSPWRPPGGTAVRLRRGTCRPRVRVPAGRTPVASHRVSGRRPCRPSRQGALLSGQTARRGRSRPDRRDARSEGRIRKPPAVAAAIRGSDAAGSPRP